MNSKKGMTLIEIIIVVMILLIVLLIIYKSYTIVYNKYKTQTKITEMDTEKLISLEILRKDIEMAGFGIPWGDNGTLPISYSESTASLPCDDEPNGEPRAVCNSDNTEPNNSDYLVIKSSMAWITNPATKKIAYLFYNSTQWQERYISKNTFNSTDYFIILEATGRKIQLVNGDWFLNLPSGKTLERFINDSYNFTGNDNQDTVYIAYGIIETNNSTSYPKPFNRVDYYLKAPSERPARCCNCTYTLYRANVNHTNGARHAVPFMDCVLDFQTAFGFDTDNDTKIDTWATDISDSSIYPASYLRDHLKQVEVFIVYQEGQKAKNPVFNTSTIQLKLPDNSTLKTINLTPYPDYQYYRWRVIKLGVDTINLKPQER